METKSFALKVKQLDGEGGFTGWAAVYNTVDLGGDLIEPGAFAKTIQDQSSVPVLWQHRPSEVIGTGRLSDGGKGLQIEGSLVLEDPVAQRAHAHLRAGSVKGLSIGYDTVRQQMNGDVRHLKELRVWEVSIATLPMNVQAQVTSVKSLDDVELLLHSLTAAELGQAETITQLKSIDRQLKALLPADPGIARAELLRGFAEIDDALKRALM